MKVWLVVLVGVAIVLGVAGIQCARGFREQLPLSPQLMEAIAKAKAGLPEFTSRLRMPRKDDKAFFIRAALGPKGHTEILWVREVHPDGKGFAGIVAEEPFRLPSIRKGDAVKVAPEDIVDWNIVREDGSQVGNFTNGLEPNK